MSPLRSVLNLSSMLSSRGSIVDSLEAMMEICTERERGEQSMGQERTTQGSEWRFHGIKAVYVWRRYECV
jgi:hypothetical protein